MADEVIRLQLNSEIIVPPASAQVGQTIVVKAVDASGRPTEWEAVPLGSGPQGPKGDSITVTDYAADDDYTTVAFSDGSTIQIPSGVGIKNIRTETEADTGNTYTVEMTRGQDYTFIAPAGPQGKTGGDGVGISVIKDNGDGTFTIYLTDNSYFDFAPPAGPQGAAGRGIQAIDYDAHSNEWTVHYTDNRYESLSGPELPEAVPGPAGPAGADGRGIKSISYNHDTNKWVVTFTDDTSSTVDGPVFPSNNARISEVDLYSFAWGEDPNIPNLYSQEVDIAGATPNTQVDLTPSIDQLVAFYEKDLTFVTENEDGVVTVYAIGQKPANDYTIQVTLTEVN